MKNLIEVLERVKVDSKRGVNFIFGEKDEFFLSYHTLYEESMKILYNLQQAGVKPGDKVIFQFVGIKEFVRIFWACVMGGMVPVNINACSNEESAGKFFNVCSIVKDYFIVTEKNTLEKIEYWAKRIDCGMEFNLNSSRILLLEELGKLNSLGCLYEPDKDELAFVQFSSGSTNDSKGVMLTHGNLLSNLDAIARGMNGTKDDVSLSWLPLTHDMGLIGFHMGAVYLGCTQNLMPTELFLRRPMLWISKASEHKASVLSSPNFGYKYFLSKFKQEEVENWDLSNVRLIYNGAEPIYPDLCNEFLDLMSNYNLKRNSMFTVYGLAEAVLAVSFSELSSEMKTVNIQRNSMTLGEKVVYCEKGEKSIELVNLGKAVCGCGIKVLDLQGNELKDNEIGIIHINGDNVTQGYLNNLQATADLFSKDGWLNTGDLGFLVKGDLFVTGRFKDIIFINGQNYFSYDLEQIAQRVEGIETGRIVVVGDADDNLKRDIVNIYVVHKKDLESFVPIAKSLREVINNVAGINVDYIIPVKSIPKTTSGKVQRYKLKDMFRSGLFDDTMKTLDMLMKQLVKSKNKTIVCRNETDRKLIEIIEKILNTSIDSIDAEFFKLGGNSLKAAEMCSEISSVFGVEVLISKIFEFNDISALSDYIDKCEKSTCKSITKLGEKEHYEMSPAQKRMFIINKLNDQDTSYNIPVLLSVDGEIDIDRLENVFFQIIHRHEILRTNMFLVDGEPRQIINSDFVFKIERCYDADKSIEEIFADFVRVFDLEKDLLIRVKYVVERSNEAYIMFDFHHIVCDGTSLGILVNEIVTMYHGKTLEPLDISYKDYSSWKNSEVKLMDKQKKFFVNLFGKPTQKLNLYHDFDTTTSNAAKGSSLNFYISEEYTQKIKAYVDRSDSTLYLVLLSVYMILLHKYSGQEDIVVGTPFADREKVELQKLVGLFVNTVPIRSNIDPALKFEDYINTLKQTVLGAYDSQGYPLDNIINDLRLRKDENEMLFSTLFTLQNMDIPPFQLGDAHLSVYDCDVGSTKFDISLEAMEKQNKVMLKFRYNTMVFRENTIVGFAEHYVNILKSVLDSSDIKISDINVISSSELRQLMSFSQSSQVNIPDKNFIDLFEEHVNECSDRIAIVYGENRLSYIELSNRVDCIVQILNERGNYGSRFIPLVMEPCIDMIAGMLAIIKAGYAFVPINADYPAERIQYIIEDCEADIVITKQKYKNKVNTAAVILSEELSLSSENSKQVCKKSYVKGLIYAIYTSGTTGKPKGVMIEGKSVINYVNWFRDTVRINKDDKTVLLSSYCFDLGYTAILSSLLYGGELHILPEEKYRDPNYVVNYISKNSITYIKLTPSLLHMLVNCEQYEDCRKFESLRLIVVGGECIRGKDIKKVIKEYPDITIMNHYGPTEATIGCITKIISSDVIEKDGWEKTIGRPISNTGIYILDKNRRPVPVGVPGEIYISGMGVSKGYINQEKLTASCFIKERFDTINEIIGYKSGDKGLFNENGDILFLGRIDKQVKIRGYRVEVSEIEQNILECGKVDDVVVLARENESGEHSLYAYFVSSEISVDEIRQNLINKLPSYMIPSYFIEVDKIPLTQNGKVDTKALPMAQNNSNEKTQVLLPENEMQDKFIMAWKKVLNVNEVYLDDDFFVSGGDSIKAVEIVAELNKYNIKMELNDVFRFPKINHLRYKLENRKSVTNQDAVVGDVSLTPIQKQFFEDSDGINNYNQSIIVVGHERFDKAKLEIVFDMLTKHHDALRMNYKIDNGIVSQNNRGIDGNYYILNEYDYTSMPDWKCKMDQEIYCIESGMSIEDAPLVRSGLFKTPEADYLFITIHHLVIDGISWRIFIQDLDSAYTQIIEGNDIVLRNKTDSFALWSKKLKELAASFTIQSERKYWEKQLNQKLLPFYKDFYIDNGTHKDTEMLMMELSEAETKQLTTQTNIPFNTELTEILLTALAKSFNELYGDEKICLSLEGHGRTNLVENIDVSRTIGWFTSVYPAILDICGGKDLSEMIINIKESLRRIPNKGIGYGLLKYFSENTAQEDSNLHDVHPDISFNYLGEFDNILDFKQFSIVSNSISLFVNNQRKRRFALQIDGMIINKKLRFSFSYSTRQYLASTVEQIITCFKSNISEIINYTQAATERRMSPSDFGDSDLTMEELDTITKFFLDV